MNLDFDLSQGFAVLYCNILTLVVAVILVALLVYVLVYHFLHIDKLHEPSFRKRYGPLYEGLKLGNFEEEEVHTKEHKKELEVTKR